MTDHGVMDTKRKYRFDPPRQPTYILALKIAGYAVGFVATGILSLVVLFLFAFSAGGI